MNVKQIKCGSQQGDSETYEDAIMSSQADAWKAAMISEMESLAANNTCSLVNLPHGKKAIKCKWVFKTKVNANGDKVCNKARLAVKACSQQKGIDFEETFAPVVRYTSLPLYGLKQPSRIWNKRLNEVLEKFGLQGSEVDQCVYYSVKGEKIFYVAIYVDILQRHKHNQAAEISFSHKLQYERPW